MASSPSLKDLNDAILTNSSAVVKSYLMQGASANQNHASVLPRNASIVNGEFRIENKDCIAATVNSTDNSISSLHLAIINYYNHVHSDNAKEILTTLLDNGANVNSVTSGIVVRLKESTNGVYETNTYPLNGTTPLQLVIFLRQQALHTSHHYVAMGRASKILVDYSKNHPGHITLPAKTVPQSVFATWKNLLFSSNFSDVTFVCKNDGTELHAHKNVLAAASPYFHSYFHGPWGEQHPNGTWETTNSPDTMKQVLTFIYTGELPLSTVDSNASDLLRMAQEYNLPELLQLCEASCIAKMSIENIKDMLLLAHVHQSNTLETACFDFVKKNAADILTNPEIMALATDQPDLWTKLSKAISSSDKKRKRGSSGV